MRIKEALDIPPFGMRTTGNTIHKVSLQLNDLTLPSWEGAKATYCGKSKFRRGCHPAMA